MKIVDHWLVSDPGESVLRKESPNHGGVLAPRFLVMHYTAGRSADSSSGWLCDPRAKASAHVVVGKEGKVIQLVPFNVVAWHAGASSWAANGALLSGLNHYAIGIELDNPGRLVRSAAGRWRALDLGIDYPDTEVIEAVHKNETRSAGWHVYPQIQLDTAFEIATLLFETYRLEEVMGHDDIAPGRKPDPGPAFPMENFRGRLLGRGNDDLAGAPQFTTTTALNLRAGPNVLQPMLIPRPLPKGTRVAVLASEGVWQRVDIVGSMGALNPLQGWVNGRYLAPAPTLSSR